LDVQVGQFFKSAMVWETWQHGWDLAQVRCREACAAHSRLWRLFRTWRHKAAVFSATAVVATPNTVTVDLQRQKMINDKPAEERHLTLDSRPETLQDCGGSSLAHSTYSSFTVASLDVPLGACWTVNQVCDGHADATQHPGVWADIHRIPIL
jgi:hypothetical protein